MNGNVPPPWLNAILKLGTSPRCRRSIMRGDRQARVGRVADRIEQGLRGKALHQSDATRGRRCATPSRSASWKKPWNSAMPSDLPFTFEPSSTPGKPRLLMWASSLAARSGSLQRHDPRPMKRPGAACAPCDDHVVGVAAEVEGVRRREPVGAELGHRGDHLEVDALSFHVPQPPLDVPVAVVHRAVVLAADHDARRPARSDPSTATRPTPRACRPAEASRGRCAHASTIIGDAPSVVAQVAGRSSSPFVELGGRAFCPARLFHRADHHPIAGDQRGGAAWRPGGRVSGLTIGGDRGNASPALTAIYRALSWRTELGHVVAKAERSRRT